MNKRITSLMLVFTLILTMLATAVPALAAPSDSTCTYSIEADKTSANPGDTITFTIYMQQTGTQNSMEGTLVIPDGLTYVAGSGKVEEGVSSILNWTQALEGVAWTESAMLINGFGAISYTGTDKLALMKFQCTVDNDATAKDYEVTLIDLVADDENYDTKNPTCIPAVVTVTPAPKPATGISLNKSTLELTVGESETLVATVTPADTTDTVTWESNKTNIATVNSTGEVTAVAPGEAIITAKAGSVSATCTVKVSCAHNLQTVSAKESNCTEKGWDEYQECTLCGALFDTSGDPIEEIPYRALNDDHDFNMDEWGYKGADGHAHVCTRNPDHKDGVVPHTSSGSATEDTEETCTVCGYEIAPATGHVCANHLTKVEEKLTDCTNPGNIEHYKCSGDTGCGKLYKDADALVPTTAEEVKLDALGHDWKAATCTDPKTCDRCHITEGEALGHDWKDATCTDPKTCNSQVEVFFGKRRILSGRPYLLFRFCQFGGGGGQLFQDIIGYIAVL